tara:strand:- start:41 stop:790 length:750 start_codon:yes stop_codon:yes gene_type:complete
MTELIFIDAKWDGEISLTIEVINYLKENTVKKLALFSSVQFTDIEIIKQQLLEVNIEPLITKAKRTNKELQILGCDIYHDNFQNNIIEEADFILYIGDGLFHPKALLLAQIKNEKIKPIILYDPMAKQFQILTEKNIEKQIQKLKRNLKMFVNATTIGILVTIKPGQQYFNAAKNLKKSLEEENKKAYIFIGDSLNLTELENYPFIDAWVNTACPRIGSDDLVNTEKPLINLREAFDPGKEIEDLEFKR